MKKIKAVNKAYTYVYGSMLAIFITLGLNICYYLYTILRIFRGEIAFEYHIMPIVIVTIFIFLLLLYWFYAESIWAYKDYTQTADKRNLHKAIEREANYLGSVSYGIGFLLIAYFYFYIDFSALAK